MAEKLFYQLFECFVVIVEAIFLNYYLNIFFSQVKNRYIKLICLVIYASISMLLSVFSPDVILLSSITLLSTLFLTFFLCDGSPLSKIFTSLFYVALAVGIEFFVWGIFQLIDFIDIDVFRYRPVRIVYAVTAKLLQLLLLRLIHIFVKRKDAYFSFSFREMMPLLIYQLVSIILVFLLLYLPEIMNQELNIPFHFFDGGDLIYQFYLTLSF
jgi:hypothetical protein